MILASSSKSAPKPKSQKAPDKGISRMSADGSRVVAALHDLDGDGQVSKLEAKVDTRINLDANADGKVSKEETLLHLDYNGDGQVTKREVAKKLEALGGVDPELHAAYEHAGGVAVPGGASSNATVALVATADTDHSGKVSKREAILHMAGALDVNGDGQVSRHEAVFALDANGDGQVARKEALHELQARVSHTRTSLPILPAHFPPIFRPFPPPTPLTQSFPSILHRVCNPSLLPNSTRRSMFGGVAALRDSVLLRMRLHCCRCGALGTRRARRGMS